MLIVVLTIRNDSKCVDIVSENVFMFAWKLCIVKYVTFKFLGISEIREEMVAHDNVAIVCEHIFVGTFSMFDDDTFTQVTSGFIDRK